MQAYQSSLASSWPLVPLGAICEVGAGNGAPQGDAYYAGGTYPFVRMQDVGRCQTPYVTATADRLNDLALEKHSLRQWPAGSLLIPKSGASVALNKRALLRYPAYVVSHLAVLVPGPFIDSEYLYHLSRTLDMMRLALDPAYPSLRTSDLARLRIPLPPLSEQQRIVEILREAEEIHRLRIEAEAKTSQLIPAIFFQFFENAERHFDNIPLRELVDEFRYGTSQSSGDRGTTTLRIPNILGDRISFDDLVKVDENDDSLERLRLLTGDILFVRTNGNPDYIGRSCVFDQIDAEREVGANTSVIFASYLIRARLKPDRMRPWFLHAYLRSPLGRARILKHARTAAGQYNINTEGLGAIKVPAPPLDLQDRFLLEATEIQQIAEMARRSEKQMAALHSSLSAHGFSGQLTADWRDAHQDTLALEVRVRDAVKISGATLARSRAMIPEIEELLQDRIDGIYAELNREQRHLLQKIKRMVRDVSQVGYFSAHQLSNYLTEGPLRRNPHAIEAHLLVFATRGIIIPVSREQQTEDTGEFVFGNAYRLPLKDYEPRAGEEGEPRFGDYYRLSELERLANRVRRNLP